jgi:anaerobic selenocysteine-containing dehydrogenase
MGTREATAVCRICFGSCAMKFTLDENDRIVSARGDKSNPLTRGYACVKGLYAHETHYHPDRILHPLKRQADGTFARFDLNTALDEIAAKLEQIIARYGPDAVAALRGTPQYMNVAVNYMMPDWLTAIGSKSFFSTVTIDQSAKWVAVERLGMWGAGADPFASADVLMMVGVNPFVSLGAGNLPSPNPVKTMRDARARGLKLIVIDPRRSETARHADMLLQPLPGEDVTVMAGLLNIILRERWHDKEFCARHVNNLEGLAAAVADYTPEYVSRRADVAVADLLAAARLFAEPIVTADGTRRKRGGASSGTAPNMVPHSNLAEHLVQCLNVVCGRFARPGDVFANSGVMGPRPPMVATVYPPQRSWEKGWRSRVGNIGMIFGEKMTGVLAQEILTPGQDQVRALFAGGANPANAVPGEEKMTAALRDLDLLVSIDPFMSNTARLAHYIIPPKMMLERPDTPSRFWEPFMMPIPYAQYSEAVIPIPAGAEVVDEWYVFWALAKRMGKTIVFDGVALDRDTPPTNEELLAIVARHSRLSFEEIKRQTSGKIFDLPPMVVQPEPEGATGRFEVIPEDVGQELAEVRQEVWAAGEFPFRLAVRRMREAQNSSFRNAPTIHRMVPYNAAHIHPEDLAALGIGSGDTVQIASAHGSIDAIVEADDSLRRGIVSISHGWGDGGLGGQRESPDQLRALRTDQRHAGDGRRSGEGETAGQRVQSVMR